jgi:hypothetical protein
MAGINNGAFVLPRVLGGRVIVWVVVAGRPSALRSKGVPRKASGALNDQTAAVDIVSEVVAKSSAIGKWVSVDDHHDVVLLKLHQSRRPNIAIEPTDRGHVRVSLDGIADHGRFHPVRIGKNDPDAEVA